MFLLLCLLSFSYNRLILNKLFTEYAQSHFCYRLQVSCLTPSHDGVTAAVCPALPN